MALHINLFHEIQKEAQQRARDPFKLGGLAAVAVFTLLVVFYVYRMMEVSAIERKLARTKAEWATLEPQERKAKKEEKQFLAAQTVNAALMKRIEGRFYWAPLLQTLSTSIPESIQILSLNGQSGGKFFAEAAKADVVLLLDGIAAGESPRNVAEAFRRSLQESLAGRYKKALVNYDSGNALEETPAVVRLKGEEYPTARFKLRVALSRAELQDSEPVEEPKRPQTSTGKGTPPSAIPSPKPVKRTQ